MGLICKIDDLVNQSLCDHVKINEETSRCGKHIESLVKVSTKINFLDDFTNDQRNSLDLCISTQGINFVMQRFGNLEN